MRVVIRLLKEDPFEVEANAEHSISTVKQLIQEHKGIPPSRQHLISNKTELADDSSLETCGVIDGATLLLLLGEPTIQITLDVTDKWKKYITKPLPPATLEVEESLTLDGLYEAVSAMDARQLFGEKVGEVYSLLPLRKFENFRIRVVDEIAKNSELWKESDKKTLKDIGLQNGSTISVDQFPNSWMRIQKELNDMADDPGSNLMYFPLRQCDDEWRRFEASLVGPKGTPYEGGTFVLDIELPTDYPFKPPQVRFKTNMYHCNVNSNGGVSLDILRDQWAPSLTISKVLLSMSSLLANPNPYDPLVPEIAQLFLKDRAQHDEIAKQWTQKYAM